MLHVTISEMAGTDLQFAEYCVRIFALLNGVLVWKVEKKVSEQQREVNTDLQSISTTKVILAVKNEGWRQ